MFSRLRNSDLVQVTYLAFLAVLVTSTAWSLVPAAHTSLHFAPYDLWSRLSGSTASSEVTAVLADEWSHARFGSGP